MSGDLDGGARGAGGCADPGRSMFYDRVGRYFHDASEIVAFPVPLPCIACGAMLGKGVVVDGKGACAAQRSITAKRAGVNDPLPHELPEGTPEKRRSAFNAQKKAVFITPDTAFAITSVRPLSPLPPDLTIRTEGTHEVYGELYALVYGRPLSVPALYVEFGQSGSFEFAITRSPDVLLRCGGSTVEAIDAGRVREIVAAGRAVGVGGLRRFNQLRSQYLRNELVTPRERQEYVAIRDAIVASGIDPASPPNPGEAAYRIAGIILRADEPAPATETEPA